MALIARVIETEVSVTKFKTRKLKIRPAGFFCWFLMGLWHSSSSKLGHQHHVTYFCESARKHGGLEKFWLGRSAKRDKSPASFSEVESVLEACWKQVNASVFSLWLTYRQTEMWHCHSFSSKCAAQMQASTYGHKCLCVYLSASCQRVCVQIRGALEGGFHASAGHRWSD